MRWTHFVSQSHNQGWSKIECTINQFCNFYGKLVLVVPGCLAVTLVTITIIFPTLALCCDTDLTCTPAPAPTPREHQNFRNLWLGVERVLYHCTVKGLN